MSHPTRPGPAGRSLLALLALMGRVGHRRVDIGTSMGSRGGDKEAYLQHSAQTLELFDEGSELWGGGPSAVACLHDTAAQLAGKPVVGAFELDDDGVRRGYGPAIVRCYHEGGGHGPHLDSLARDRAVLEAGGKSHRATDYTIGRFERQLSAVLCLQASDPPAEDAGARSGEAVLHRFRPAPDDTTVVKNFNTNGGADGVESAAVALAAGDFYLFCSEFVHEVPFVTGQTPRVVLASFLGVSDAEPALFAWA